MLCCLFLILFRLSILKVFRYLWTLLRSSIRYRYNSPGFFSICRSQFLTNQGPRPLVLKLSTAFNSFIDANYYDMSLTGTSIFRSFNKFTLSLLGVFRKSDRDLVGSFSLPKFRESAFFLYSGFDPEVYINILSYHTSIVPPVVKYFKPTKLSCSYSFKKFLFYVTSTRLPTVKGFLKIFKSKLNVIRVSRFFNKSKYPACRQVCVGIAMLGVYINIILINELHRSFYDISINWSFLFYIIGWFLFSVYLIRCLVLFKK
jgi:hypothetical protein